MSIAEFPTGRQLEIMSMCARGWSREEIGRELFISPWTVKYELDRLRDLVDARNVTHALAICVTAGYLVADGAHGVRVPEVEPEPTLAAAA